MRVDDLRAYFAGRWSVVRRITDRRSAAPGRFIGEAVFSPVEDGLRYDERGTLALDGDRHPATRAYVYRFEEPCRGGVWFDDGRYFHPLDLRDGWCRVEHLCGADVYRGAFRLRGAGHWTLAWSVRGPRKALVIRSHYRRAAG